MQPCYAISNTAGCMSKQTIIDLGVSVSGIQRTFDRCVRQNAVLMSFGAPRSFIRSGH